MNTFLLCIKFVNRTAIKNFGKAFIIFSLLLLSGWIARSQNSREDIYESFNVTISFDGIGQKSFFALYKDPDGLYLPVDELFDFLKIYRKISDDGTTIQGYIETEENAFEISYNGKYIDCQSKKYPLQTDDAVLDMGTLFLKKEILEKAFGFTIDFNFRSLSAKFSAAYELPLSRALKLEKARERLNARQEKVASYDTILPRTYHWFKFGMVDWSVTANQGNSYYGKTRFGLGAGAEIFGGETNVWLNYSDYYGLERDQQRYYWRWVNNQSSLIKQMKIGRLTTSSISSLLSPVDGFMITNAPTTVRKASGNYNISDFTEPGWMVELYINNVLTEYTRADASGFYSFEIPIVYGTSNVMLRFYGPNGEERSEEKTFNMPYTMLPRGEFEYKITGGTLLDTLDNTRFGRVEAGYGITRWLTAGTGMEYLSSLDNNNIPFVNFSLQPFARFILTGEYAHQVRIKGTLNYSSPNNTVLSIKYAKYKDGQDAIIYNYKEERQVSLSLPMHIRKISGFAKTSVRQNVYNSFTYNTGQLILTGYYKNFNANLSNYCNWTNLNSSNFYSNLALGIRIKGFTFRPSVQYNYSDNQFIYYKAKVEKTILRNGYLSMGYEDNLLSDYKSLNISFRYNFSFMSSYFSSYFNNKKIQASESAKGSFAFGSGNDYVLADSYTAVGRCGISIEPFVDVNFNGVHDKGEPFAEKLNVRCSGGKVCYREKDPIVRIYRLEPFVDYTVTIDESNFDNIAWRVSEKNIKVCTDPNQFKKISVAVLPVGEVSGMVTEDTPDGRGIGRILVNIVTPNGKMVTKMQSEFDGFFSYLGLPPGNYIAKIDSVQLSKLNMTAPEIPFVIHENAEGDIIDIGSIVLKHIQIPTNAVKIITTADTTDYETFYILFAFDKSDIKPEFRELLQYLAEKMKEKTCLNLMIEGHTDSDGTSDYNQKLSEHRATSVKKFLIKQGIAPDRLQIIGYGEMKPLTGNKTKSEKAANRRVRFKSTNKNCDINLDSLFFQIEQKHSIKKNNNLSEKNTNQTKDTVSPEISVEQSDVAHTYKMYNGLLLDYFEGKYTIQTGAFKAKENAQKLAKKIKEKLPDLEEKVFIVKQDGFYKVQVYYFTNIKELHQCADNINKLNIL